MKISDALAISTRMFKARLLRTFLTVLGMSIGIGAILFLVSLGYGLQRTLLDRITTADSLLTLDVSEAPGDVVLLSSKVIEELQAHPDVAEVSPSARLVSQAKFNEKLIDLNVFVATPTFLRLGGMRIDIGDTLHDDAPNGLIVSSSLAKAFSQVGGKDLLGQEMHLKLFEQSVAARSDGNENARVPQVSIGEGMYTISGIVSSEENVVYINAKSVSDVSISRYALTKVRVRTKESLATVRDLILSKGFVVSSLSDTVDQANNIFGILQLVLMLFGVIALVVSAIGMFNTMTIALLERTEEIGIMKSLGASDANISALFILESTIMGFLGGALGVFSGFLGGRGLNVFVNFLASRFGGQSVDLFFSPTWFVWFILVFSGFVGLLTGFFPARRASKVDPLEALRYK
jgi:putative ABC transport system permease protein